MKMENQSENELFQSMQKKKMAARAKREAELAQKLRKEKIQKVKAFLLSLLTAQAVILLFAAFVNIASIVFSIYLIADVYALVLLAEYTMAAGVTLLLIITNAYVFWFNKQFSIKFQP